MAQSFAESVRATGRPRGTRVKPKADTIAESVLQALSDPPKPPPPAPPKPKNPKRKAGIWENLTPEERSAHGKKLAAMRSSKNMARTCQRTGTPKSGGWTHESASVAKAAARIESETLVRKLVADGKVQEADAEATIEALTIVRSPGARTERVKWAKRLLRHFAPDMTSLL